MHIFNSATKAMEEIMQANMHLGNRVQNIDAPVRLRFAKGPGVEGRPNFPLWHYTATWLRAHIEQPRITRAQIARNLQWIPNFDNKPTPIWKPGAPCGFNAVVKFAIKQDAMMKQKHRSALMYRQWKIMKI